MRYIYIKWTLIILVAISIALSCRESIIYVNDIEYIYEVCDTISTKYNHPNIGDVTYTVRCTDQFGNERTYLITGKP